MLMLLVVMGGWLLKETTRDRLLLLTRDDGPLLYMTKDGLLISTRTENSVPLIPKSSSESSELEEFPKPLLLTRLRLVL